MNVNAIDNDAVLLRYHVLPKIVHHEFRRLVTASPFARS